MVVLVLGSLGLCVRVKAGLALDHHRRPRIEYAISGIRGANGWFRGSRRGDFVVLRWIVRDSGAVVVFTLGCRKEIIKGPTAGTTRTCTAWSDNGIASRTTELIKIDADPPRLGAVFVSNSTGSVRLRWKASRGAHFLVSRSPGRAGASWSVVYQGTQPRFVDRTVTGGVKYDYKLRAIDQAGNSVTKTVSAMPRRPLFAPAAGVRLSSPESIFFAWTAAPAASYYNLQLWFEGARVFSAWPSLPRFRLRVPWEYGGVRRYLRAGRYTWYVWPGQGSRSLGAYGPRLGSSTFFVAR